MNFMNFARLLRLTRLIPPLRLSLSKPDRRALLHTGFDRLSLSGGGWFGLGGVGGLGDV